MTERAVGGYFELELPHARQGLYLDAYKFQSARAAFYALLMSKRPQRVWVPYYGCNAIPDFLEEAGVECKFYSINQNFEIIDDLDFAENDWLLYINYFGLCAQQQLRVLEKFPPQQVVFDHAQAFFSAPLDCLATLYSPRKFFGVPDGGYLVTNAPVGEPLEVDEGSVRRANHLLTRLAISPEAGYADYQIAEKDLIDPVPKRMSVLTERLLDAIDMGSVKSKRTENFFFLHEKLGRLNELVIDKEMADGPLCYPFLSKHSGIREALLAARVFVPVYWPEVKAQCSSDSTEYLLADRLIAVPCDQRYEMKDFERVINIIQRVSEN
jgi:hypothetical protein